jgi:hypothetical protein
METIMPRDQASLTRALAENTRDLFVLPGHESIWHHRRWLLLGLRDFLTVPSMWIAADSPAADFKYPVLANDTQIVANYSKICDAFCISINLVLVQPNASKTVVDLDLAIEDTVIAVARSDNFPCEFAAQKRAAEKHFRWLRCQFMRPHTG